MGKCCSTLKMSCLGLHRGSTCSTWSLWWKACEPQVAPNTNQRDTKTPKRMHLAKIVCVQLLVLAHRITGCGVPYQAVECSISACLRGILRFTSRRPSKYNASQRPLPILSLVSPSCGPKNPLLGWEGNPCSKKRLVCILDRLKFAGYTLKGADSYTNCEILWVKDSKGILSPPTAERQLQFHFCTHTPDCVDPCGPGT